MLIPGCEGQRNQMLGSEQRLISSWALVGPSTHGLPGLGSDEMLRVLLKVLWWYGSGGLLGLGNE